MTCFVWIWTKSKINTLKSGGIPIHEPGLLEMVQRNVAAGRLHFTTSIEESVAFGVIQFIAVGTPPDEDGSADLQYVTAAARNIARHMTDYKVVVDKSTVPVGTADKVQCCHQRRARQTRYHHPVRRRLQSGIPQGRRGRGRLHAP